MTSFIDIHPLSDSFRVEMAERKGIGHPDTLCDDIAEQVSVALCNYYLDHFGRILHYNVDKALLVGGKSNPAYKGGEMIEPIELYLAGRATTEVKGRKIPVEEIAVNAAMKLLSNNIRFLDREKHIRIIPKIRAGSNDLVELFQHFGKEGIPLANDTSFGVGYYPFSTIEKHVLEMEMLLNSKDVKQKFPFIGEDIKVMGVQGANKKQFTIAIAVIDRFISGIQDYVEKVNSVKGFIALQFGLHAAEVQVNTADDYQKESIYLTVTGTSAESGDDGQVGRGNRVNGLITPCRPMSLEASSGKNPVSHVGKIYNHFAFDLSKAIVENHFAEEARVFIVSQIGKPITQPQLLNIQIKNSYVDKKQIAGLATEKLNEVPLYWKKFVSSLST